jgi:hypothetical protein
VLVTDMSKKLESNLVGVAGEYFVAAELSRRGFIASITLRNSRGIDILASNSDGSKSITIQVKTNSDGSANWILNKKSELYYSDNHFYVFVALGILAESPKFHIVKSDVVAKYIRDSHQQWLSGKKKDGTERKDSSMRKFSDPGNKFQDSWTTLSI